jgi:hypothetical protein
VGRVVSEVSRGHGGKLSPRPASLRVIGLASMKARPARCRGDSNGKKLHGARYPLIARNIIIRLAIRLSAADLALMGRDGADLACRPGEMHLDAVAAVIDIASDPSDADPFTRQFLRPGSPGLCNIR